METTFLFFITKNLSIDHGTDTARNMFFKFIFLICNVYDADNPSRRDLAAARASRWRIFRAKSARRASPFLYALNEADTLRSSPAPASPARRMGSTQCTSQPGKSTSDPTSGDTAAKLPVPFSGQKTSAALWTLRRTNGTGRWVKRAWVE